MALSGSVWVEHSRRYANPDTYLIPPAEWPGRRLEVIRQTGTQGSGELRPVALGATGFLRENPYASCRVEGIELEREVLVLGGHTGIANGHGHGGTSRMTGASLSTPRNGSK
jgi:hypothetical protein